MRRFPMMLMVSAVAALGGAGLALGQGAQLSAGAGVQAGEEGTTAEVSAGSDASAPQPAPAAAAGTESPGQSLEATKKPSLGDQEMLQKAEAIMAKGRELSLALQFRLDEAKNRAGDEGPNIILIECLNQKLNQVNRRAGDRGTLAPHVAKLKTAVATGDGEARDFEFGLIEIVGQEIADLEREAALCTGDEQFYTSEVTSVVTEMTGTMPATTGDSNVLPVAPAGGDTPTTPVDGPPPGNLEIASPIR
ncbi:MAG: hypothetical protein ACPGUV_07970 [Polyangiales bacterium]